MLTSVHHDRVDEPPPLELELIHLDVAESYVNTWLLLGVVMVMSLNEDNKASALDHTVPL